MSLEIALMPVVAAAIGWFTNWVGIKLIFYPVGFVGIPVPQARGLLRLLPRAVGDLPGLSHSAIGWQGIVPSRAPRIASLAFDSGIANLADPKSILAELDTDRVAAELTTRFEPEIDEAVDRLARQRYPRVWDTLPASARSLIRGRVREQTPQLVRNLIGSLERSLDEVFDPKLMVIDQMTARPSLATKLSQAIGEKDLAVVVNLGLVFGGLFGVAQAGLWTITEAWWLLPLLGLLVGTATNYLALKLLFVPRDPVRVGPFTLQGSFMRRQSQVAEGYAKVLADDLLTLETVSDELLNGPRSDRFRALLESELSGALDDLLGPGSVVARVVASGRYDALKTELTQEMTSAVPDLLSGERGREAAARQRAALRDLIQDRLGALDRDAYAGLILPIIEEDAWLVYLVGAVLGLVVGSLQLLLVL